MTEPDLFTAVWRKSHYSGGATNCVEVTDSLAPIVAVRDSKNPAGSALTFTRGAWHAFTASVQSGGGNSRLRSPSRRGCEYKVPSVLVLR